MAQELREKVNEIKDQREKAGDDLTMVKIIQIMEEGKQREMKMQTAVNGMENKIKDAAQRMETFEAIKEEVRRAREKGGERTDDKDTEKDTMRGFKTKDVPKPEPFDMAPEEFEEWHELFKAQLLSQDSKWSKVLEVMNLIKRE